jgi:HEAT repeat protein
LKEALDKTWNILTNSPNRAAVAVLLSALKSRHVEIKLGAIRSLVQRRSAEGHSEIIRRFVSFGELESAALAEAIQKSAHHMKSALHDAVLAENVELCESACRMILLGRVYDTLPTLVKAAENRSHRHSDQAAATLVQLASVLHAEISGEAHDRTCDPFFMRRQVLASLERSLSLYQAHRRVEIVDAFLDLVPSDNALLAKILSDARHPCHQPIIASLSTSAVTPILDLLAELLQDAHVPSCVVQIIAKRQDRKFLNHLLGRLGMPVSLRVSQNLKRMAAITWLQQGRAVLPHLDGRAQAVAVEVAAASGLDRAELFQLLAFLLKQPGIEGRRASCAALARFSEPQANQLVLTALADPDPGVKAAAIRQLRPRRVPGAMEKLISLLDSPAAEVRDAARSSLSEFSFFRYQASFDGLDAAARRTTGKLVRKVDLTATRRLAETLNSPSLAAKLRALEMVAAMNAAEDVCNELITLADDKELAVRTDAVVALGTCTGSKALAALRKAEQDPQRAVREAAKRSIERYLGNRDKRAPDEHAITGTSR